jgi:tRNA(fMet)-specific endonuclease VapC
VPVRYLLDTNIARYVIKGNFPRVRERLIRVAMAEVGISAVTEAELRCGAARRPEASGLRLAIEEFIIRVEVLPWDSAAARSYAVLRAELEERGLPLGNLDLMIASHALATTTTLVTHDRVFRHVKKLKVEDWTK